MNSKLLIAIGVGLIAISSLMKLVIVNRELRNEEYDSKIEASVNKLNETFKSISRQDNWSGAQAAKNDFIDLTRVMHDVYIESGADETRKDQAKQVAVVLHEFLQDLARSSFSKIEFDMQDYDNVGCLVTFAGRFGGILIKDLEKELSGLFAQENGDRKTWHTEYKRKLRLQQPFVPLPERRAVKKEDQTLIYILGTLGGASLLAGIGTIQLRSTERGAEIETPRVR